MTVLRLGCIVEGDGDKLAIPTLFQRIAARVVPGQQVVIDPRHIVPSGSLRDERACGAAVEAIARNLGGHGAILILADADDDCPAQLGPRILRWAQATRRDMTVGVVLANREYECWFIAAESLAG